MKKLAIVSVFAVALMVSASASAKEFTGFWTTIDDETKEKKSVVQIVETNGVYSGTIVNLFRNKNSIAKLPGSPKILGLQIIRDMRRGGKGLKGGSIIDPKKGKTYGCEIWREGANLVVRGKIAFLGRNQIWRPSAEEDLR